jgi:hypothetical protein
MQAQQLLLFVQMDLKTFKVQNAGPSNGALQSADPPFPKSLFLVQPLFEARLHLPSTSSAPPPPISLENWIVPSEIPLPKPDRKPRIIEDSFNMAPTVEKKKKTKRKTIQQADSTLHTATASSSEQVSDHSWLAENHSCKQPARTGKAGTTKATTAKSILHHGQYFSYIRGGACNHPDRTTGSINT